jgi:hypothetical protein
MNWHDRRGTAAPQDHERDLRKHDPRPGEKDYVPLCAQSAPLSTTMDIVLCVRGMDNLQEAARLIDIYTDLKASERRLEAIAAGARP